MSSKPMASQPSDTSSYRLIVVDDDSMIRESLKAYLTHYHQANYSLLVDEASTAEEAVTMIDKTPYDLVICDINLPDRDGFYVMHQAAERVPEARRVLITAYDLDRYIRMAKQEGVFNIITKTAPFDFQELSQTINNLLMPESAMGLENYLNNPIEPMQSLVVTNSDLIMVLQGKLHEFFTRFQLPDVDALSVVMIEAITNAVYHAPRLPNGEEKYEKGQHIEALDPDEYVTVSWGVDGEKLGVAIRDQKGTVTADEVMYWIDRNVAGESLMDTHGRGMYLIYRLMDRVILNLYRGHATELILLHYISQKPPDNKPLYINEF